MAYKRPTAKDRDAWLKEKQILKAQIQKLESDNEAMHEFHSKRHGNIADERDEALATAAIMREKFQAAAEEINAAREFIKQLLRHF